MPGVSVYAYIQTHTYIHIHTHLQEILQLRLQMSYTAQRTHRKTIPFYTHHLLIMKNLKYTDFSMKFLKEGEIFLR